MMTDIKDHGVSISISSILSISSAIGIVWFVIQPLLIGQISDALAQDFEQQIEAKQQPVQSAFKVLLRSEINDLKKQIARMEVHINDDDWMEEDAELLAELHIELDALQEAYAEL